MVVGRGVFSKHMHTGSITEPASLLAEPQLRDTRDAFDRVAGELSTELSPAIRVLQASLRRV
jgi:hypothetical protein